MPHEKSEFTSSGKCSEARRVDLAKQPITFHRVFWGTACFLAGVLSASPPRCKKKSDSTKMRNAFCVHHVP